MNFETSRIINSNGTLIRVGWDELGWFSMARVRETPSGEYKIKDGAEIVSIPPDKTDEIKDAIETKP